MKKVAFTLVSIAWMLLGGSCKQDHSLVLQQLQDELDKVEPELVATKRMASKLRIELEEARKKQAEASDAFDETRESLKKLAVACHSAAKALTDYQDEYQETISKRAVGMNLGTLSIGTKTYASAKVKALDAWDLAIEHSGGITRIPLRDLPPDLQTKFGYDPDVGEKPVEVVAISESGVPPPEVADAPETGNAPSQAPISVPVPSRGAACSMPQRSKGRSSSGGGSAKTGSGISIEVLSRWRANGGGMGGGSSSGSKVKGATSPVPNGYKPIGSNYSGSGLDKNKNQ